MVGKQENLRSSPTIKKEISPLPPIKEAGKLILSLFASPQYRDPIPEITEELLMQNLIRYSPEYTKFIAQKEPDGDRSYWDLGVVMDVVDTERSTPHSPIIFKENVGHAEDIITVTFGHHWFNIGPQEEFVFAYGDDEEVKAYFYPKTCRKRAKGLLPELNSLNRVGELVNYRNEWRKLPIRISLWQADTEEQFYSLVASFKTEQVSFNNLLRSIQNPQ